MSPSDRSPTAATLVPGMQRQQFMLLFASLCPRHRPAISSPNALHPIASVPASLLQLYRCGQTCNPGTAALVSRVPYEPSCQPFLGALPGQRGRCSGAASSSVCLPAGRDIHDPQDEKDRPSRAGGPAFASGKNSRRGTVHPSVNPSFHVSASMLWQPFV